MILLDANLLVYAVNADAPLNRKAKSWRESVLSGPETVGCPWIALLAFLRLAARAAVFRRPLSADAAFEVVAAWFDRPCSTIVHPDPRYWAVLRGLLIPVGTGGNLTSDAGLAALAIGQGADLCSCGNDFARFPGLRWRSQFA